MDGEFHIAFVSDGRYLPYVKVASASMQRSASSTLCVHVINTEDEALACRLRGVPKYHGSLAMYAKILLPELLPDVDWVLYADGDTLCVGDVCEVFKYCDDSKLIVGSRDPVGFNLGADRETPWILKNGLKVGDKSNGYCCTGLMLMNLKAMRSEGVVNQCLDFVQRYGVADLAEQTVLNCVCFGRIGLLPRQWGVFSMCPEGVDFRKSAIVHYPQDTPWRRVKANKLMHDLVCLWWWFQGKSTWGWRRAVFVIINACPWLVAWSPYLKSRLRPIRGLTREERRVILGRWKMRG